MSKNTGTGCRCISCLFSGTKKVSCKHCHDKKSHPHPLSIILCNSHTTSWLWLSLSCTSYVAECVAFFVADILCQLSPSRTTEDILCRKNFFTVDQTYYVEKKFLSTFPVVSGLRNPTTPCNPPHSSVGGRSIFCPTIC